MSKQTKMWAGRIVADKLGEVYWDFYESPFIFTTGLLSDHPVVTPVLVRECREDEDSIYWAWWDTKLEKFALVYYAKFLVEICFPYGTEIEEKRGEGKITNVVVEVRDVSSGQESE